MTAQKSKHRRPRPLPFGCRESAIRWLRRQAGRGRRDNWGAVLFHARQCAGRDYERHRIITAAARMAGLIDQEMES